MLSGVDPIASVAAVDPDTGAGTGADKEEDEWNRGMFLAWLVAGMVIVVVMVVLGVLFYQQQHSEAHYQHLTSKEKSRHERLVERAINNTDGSGLLWYDAMHVPASCRVEAIILWEIKHDLRPPRQKC